jgi:hypothetical protein
MGEFVWEVEREDELCHVVEVKYLYEEGQVARTMGPPEDCWPSIPDFVEIISATCEGIPFEFLEGEEEALEEAILQEVEGW